MTRVSFWWRYGTVPLAVRGAVRRVVGPLTPAPVGRWLWCRTGAHTYRPAPQGASTLVQATDGTYEVLGRCRHCGQLCGSPPAVRGPIVASSAVDPLNRKG